MFLFSFVGGKIIKVVENDYNEKELEALYEDIRLRPEERSIMGILIKNEIFYKLKREWFMVFLLLIVASSHHFTSELGAVLTTAQNHLLTCSSL